MSSERFYSRGPGSSRTRGAVEEVYADTRALEYACPECGVPVDAFCIWPESGKTRKTPCGARVRLAG